MHDFLIEFKIYFFNLAVFGMLFTDVDSALKIVLTIVVIGYTIRRWFFMEKDRQDKNNNNQDEKN